MARATSRDVVVVGSRRKAKLEAIVRRASSPQALVLRARIVLLAQASWPNARIRCRFGLHGDHRADLAAPVCPRWHTGPV